MTGRILSASIFFALFLILLGFAVAVLFESLAILTGKASTISQLAAGGIRAHPHVALFSAFVFGAGCGLLITHFSKWYSL